VDVRWNWFGLTTSNQQCPVPKIHIRWGPEIAKHWHPCSRAHGPWPHSCLLLYPMAFYNFNYEIKVICLSFTSTKFSNSFLVNSRASFGRSYIPNSLYMMWYVYSIMMDPHSSLLVISQISRKKKNLKETIMNAFHWCWTCHVYDSSSPDRLMLIIDTIVYNNYLKIMFFNLTWWLSNMFVYNIYLFVYLPSYYLLEALWGCEVHLNSIKSVIFGFRKAHLLSSRADNMPIDRGNRQ